MVEVGIDLEVDIDLEEDIDLEDADIDLEVVGIACIGCLALVYYLNVY